MSTLDLNSAIPESGQKVNWLEIEAWFEFKDKLLACPQEPLYHAEGDVWTHTKMVVDSLVDSLEWQSLGADNKFICFWAAMLHDIGKPLTTKVENGLITSKGHSKVGAIDSRIWLWKNGIDFNIREEICGIIENHQIPFFILKKQDPVLLARKISWQVNWNNLMLVARHDMIGRIYSDKENVLFDMDLADEWLERENLKVAPYADNYTRLMYLSSPSTVDPTYALYEPDYKCEVIMLSGLPASGKNTLIEQEFKDWGHVSFDDERQKLGIKPGQDSGPAVHAAFDSMKKFLREHKKFVFNATNISPSQRKKALDIFYNYGAKVKIIYLEKSWKQLVDDDKKRSTKVGKDVISSMLFKWEPPTYDEAIEVEYRIITKPLKFKNEIKKK